MICVLWGKVSIVTEISGGVFLKEVCEYAPGGKISYLLVEFQNGIWCLMDIFCA